MVNLAETGRIQTEPVHDDGPPPAIDLGPYEAGRWYHVRTIIDRANLVYSVWIDGELKAEAVPLPDTYGIGALMLASGHANVKVYFDDVMVFDSLGDTLPMVSRHPQSTTVLAGNDATFSATAWGTPPLTYQWRSNGTNIAGATTKLLTLSKVQQAAEGNYDLVVANDLGSVTSKVAVLTVRDFSRGYYNASFDGAVGPEWSTGTTDVTPVGNRRFLGQFGNDTVSLSLMNLPPHTNVTVSCDLFIILTWDGNGPPGAWFAPDIWDLSVSGGPTLLHTTFSNFGLGFPDSIQAFPSNYPGGIFPGETGATETNSLGYSLSPFGDSIYYLSFSFPHTDSSLRLEFSGMGLEGIDNESWGLDNVSVALGQPATNMLYTANELAIGRTWSSLSNAPVQRVSASGNRAVVVSSDGKVHLLDLRFPDVLKLLGTWEPMLSPSDAAVAGNFVYIATYEPDFLSTIEIVDFTDPAKPAFRGYYDTPGYAQEIHVAGNLAYVADADAGLLILDVSDPAAPRRLGGYATKGTVHRLSVAGRFAYVADGNRLVMLDVNDPANPLRVGLYEAASEIRALQPLGSRLYLGEATGDLRILDVTDPRRIQLVGSYRGWGASPPALSVAGRYAYLARGDGGMQVVDVSDPAKPSWVTGTPWGQSAQDVALAGSTVLVANGDKGLASYRLEQHLYPPLKPPVISGGLMTLTWPATDGVRLQMATNLTNPHWTDIVDSEVTNTINLAAPEGNAFFRLVMGPKAGQPIQPPSGMVAWWSGDGDARDLIGASGGTLQDGTAFFDGIVNQAFNLDGHAGAVFVGANPSVDVGSGDGMTIEAWIFPRGPSGTRPSAGPIIEWEGGVHLWQLLEATTGDPLTGLLLNLYGASSNHILQTPDVIHQNKWNHVAATYSKANGTAILYVDGSPVGSKWLGEFTPYTSTPLRIGRRTPAFWSEDITFNGLIDELSLYNCALSPEEIKAVFDAGSAGKAKPPR